MSIRQKYFVLKPGGDDVYARASRTAMRVFAAEIEQYNMKLAGDIKQWCYEEERKLITGGANEIRRND